ncbi:interferon-stimulated 20 kDa exonuclease-like 2 [Polymixia lowei]
MSGFMINLDSFFARQPREKLPGNGTNNKVSSVSSDSNPSQKPQDTQSDILLNLVCSDRKRKRRPGNGMFKDQQFPNSRTHLEKKGLLKTKQSKPGQEQSQSRPVSCSSSAANSASKPSASTSSSASKPSASTSSSASKSSASTSSSASKSSASTSSSVSKPSASTSSSASKSSASTSSSASKSSASTSSSASKPSASTSSSASKPSASTSSSASKPSASTSSSASTTGNRSNTGDTQKSNTKGIFKSTTAGPSAPRSREPTDSIPSLSSPVGNPSKYVAIDCEMVGTGPKGKISQLARCSIVSYDGDVIYDKFIKPTMPVTDYRTRWSGIRWSHLFKATPFPEAKKEILKVLMGKVVVGHAIHNDFKVLGYFHPAALTRDTSKIPLLNQKAGFPGHPAVSLKRLTKAILRNDIQTGKNGHSSVEDAIATMELYKVVEAEWEKVLASGGGTVGVGSEEKSAQ